MNGDPEGKRQGGTGNGFTDTSGISGESPIARAWKDLASLWRRPKNGEGSARETLEELIEVGPGGAIDFDRQERTLLANILKLRDLTVADVMVPRADIVAMNVEAPVSEFIALVNNAGHSRIPVYQDTLDHAIGMVHIKDVVAKQGSSGVTSFRDIVRDVLFVAPSMKILELLLEMRVSRTHMALVVDEFGGVDGLLTIEDLVEEIVGEIEDEHDRESQPDIDLRSDGAVDADARVLIEDFESEFGNIVTDEEREEIDTLGGLVFSLAGRVPIRGELIRHPSGMEIEILDAAPRRIKRLRIRGVIQAPPPAA